MQSFCLKKLALRLTGRKLGQYSVCSKLQEFCLTGRKCSCYKAYKPECKNCHTDSDLQLNWSSIFTEILINIYYIAALMWAAFLKWNER